HYYSGGLSPYFLLIVQGVPSRGSAQRSNPYQPATFHAIIIKIAIINITGFELTVPASRNDIFIIAPKNAAIPVNRPTIKPSPINTSPHATMRSEEHTSELQSRFDIVCL